MATNTQAVITNGLTLGQAWRLFKATNTQAVIMNTQGGVEAARAREELLASSPKSAAVMPKTNWLEFEKKIEALADYWTLP